MDGQLQFHDEGLFVEPVLDARIRNRMKGGERAANAQDLVAEKHADRGRPLAEYLIHGEIGIKYDARVRDWWLTIYHKKYCSPKEFKSLR